VLASYIREPLALFFSLSSLTLNPCIKTINIISLALHFSASLSTILTEFVTQTITKNFITRGWLCARIAVEISNTLS
jgi:hypothetical protein